MRGRLHHDRGAVKGAVNACVSIPLDHLRHALLEGLNRDALIAFIKDLDSEIQDWEFTLKLCDYFAEQRRLYNEESKADVEALGGSS
jgi:hypothetical protein